MAPQDLIDILTECGVSLDNPMLAKAMRARDLLRAARTALSFERFQELVTACPMLLEAVTANKPSLPPAREQLPASSSTN